MELPKAYNPTEVEDKIYEQWEKSGYFNPDNLIVRRRADVFSHDATTQRDWCYIWGTPSENTIMDTEIRYQRMLGKRAVTIAGDEPRGCGYTGESEKELMNSGKYKNPRAELGREKLLEKSVSMRKIQNHYFKTDPQNGNFMRLEPAGLYF